MLFFCFFYVDILNDVTVCFCSDLVIWSWSSTWHQTAVQTSFRCWKTFSAQKQTSACQSCSCFAMLGLLLLCHYFAEFVMTLHWAICIITSLYIVWLLKQTKCFWCHERGLWWNVWPMVINSRLFSSLYCWKTFGFPVFSCLI